MTSAIPAWLPAPGLSIRVCSLSVARNRTLTRSGVGTILWAPISPSVFFGLLRQIVYVPQLEENRSPLDRMQGSKGKIQPFLVDPGAALFDSKQGGFDYSQVLAALGQVFLSQLVFQFRHRSS
jgi:hypothetical protein